MKTYNLHKIHSILLTTAVVILFIAANTQSVMGQKPFSKLSVLDNAFPATIQFSPLPSTNEAKEENSTGITEIKHKAIEDIIAHRVQ